MGQPNLAHAKVTAGGRIVIPAAFRKALGVNDGDAVVLRLQDNEVRLYSRDEALRRLQDRVAAVVPPGVSLSDELIRERRAEAEHE